ncbi:unnamed protein product, partial [Phaeothamnion confervicola]
TSYHSPAVIALRPHNATGTPLTPTFLTLRQVRQGREVQSTPAQLCSNVISMSFGELFHASSAGSFALQQEPEPEPEEDEIKFDIYGEDDPDSMKDEKDTSAYWISRYGTAWALRDSCRLAMLVNKEIGAIAVEETGSCSGDDDSLARRRDSGSTDAPPGSFKGLATAEKPSQRMSEVSLPDADTPLCSPAPESTYDLRVSFNAHGAARGTVGMAGNGCSLGGSFNGGGGSGNEDDEATPWKRSGTGLSSAADTIPSDDAVKGSRASSLSARTVGTERQRSFEEEEELAQPSEPAENAAAATMGIESGK